MRRLLAVSAALESATGLALLVAPSMPVSLLLGQALGTPGESTISRVAGAALLALGIGCWLARDDLPGRGARALVVALLFYNTAVAAVLIHAALALRLSGIGLWATVLLHVPLAAWCIACLRPVSPRAPP